MRPTKFATLGLLGLIGCVEPAPTPLPARLVLEPAQLTVTVIDGRPVAQAYRATLVDDTGAHDVTAETTFVLAGTGYGSFTGDTVQLDGTALGPTDVIARRGAVEGHAIVTVYARQTLLAGDVPAGAGALFERATIDRTCEPAISYPAPDVVVPQNLGQLDVHWLDPHDDLFEVKLATSYLDLRVYARRANISAGWTAVVGDDWKRLAAQHDAIDVSVTGLVEETPQLACASARQTLHVTDQPIAGGVFYASQDGIMRIDALQPAMTATTVLTAAMWDALFGPLVGTPVQSCIGCTVSRDGSKLGVSSSTTGAIYDFAAKRLSAPSAETWTFATFNATADKLVTSSAGALRLITDDGALLQEVRPKADYAFFDPQLSPDGGWLANVEANTGSMTAGASIIVRSYDDVHGSFGTPNELVPYVAGTANYFVAWSPDGEWLVFTRAIGWGTIDMQASIWIVRADGSTPPIQLTGWTEQTDIHARFVPQASSVGGERMFFLTFESIDAFGEQLAAGRTQLWMMPFYPDRAHDLYAGEPAFHVPAQSLATDNRLLQWTVPATR